MYASTDVLAKIEFVYKTIHSHKVRTDVLTYYHPPVALTPSEPICRGALTRFCSVTNVLVVLVSYII